jgi:hypothetical protein
METSGAQPIKESPCMYYKRIILIGAFLLLLALVLQALSI